MLRSVLAIALLVSCAPANTAEDAEEVEETEPPVTACTLIGCADALNIELTGTWPALQRVTVRALDDGEQRVIDCTQQACDQIMIPNFVTERVAITVEHADGTREEEMDVEITTSRPNGPDCPPECRTGSVVLAF